MRGQRTGMVSMPQKPATVGHYATRRLVTIESDTSAFEIANKMVQSNVSAVLIVDNGRHIGILTERDLTRQVAAKDSLPSKTPATAIMSAPVVTIGQDSRIDSAAETMAKNGVRHLAVVDGKQIIGMFTATDLFKYVMDNASSKETIPQSILEILYPTEEPTEETL